MISEGIFINGEKVTFNPENILNGDVSAYTEAIGEATQDWLDEHLEPGGSVPIDDTLSISGAAADAKKTGDEIAVLKNGLSDTNDDIFDILSGLVSGTTIATWVAGAISSHGSITNGTCPTVYSDRLTIPSGSIAKVVCDPTVEYKVVYYSSKTTQYNTWAKNSGDFTSDPMYLDNGYTIRLVARYKATPDTNIEDVAPFNTLVTAGSYTIADVKTAIDRFWDNIKYSRNLSGFICTNDSARHSWTTYGSNGGIKFTIGALNLIFRLRTKTGTSVPIVDIATDIASYVTINDSSVDVIIPKYSHALVYNADDNLLHIRDYMSASNILDSDVVLVACQYGLPVKGLLYDEYIDRAVEDEQAKGSLFSTDIFNAEPFSGEYDWQSPVVSYGALFKGKSEVESFAFFTDPHVMGFGDASRNETKMKNYFKRVQKVYNATPCSFAVCGGDMLNNATTMDEACYRLGYIKGIFDHLLDGCKFVVGNHDTNYQGKLDSASENGTGRLNNSTIASILYRDTNTKKAYYSFDGANSKCYVLDTGIEHSSMLAYDWEQIAWLAGELLQDDPEHAILFTHIIVSSGSVQSNANTIASLVEAYNSHTTITLNGVIYDFTSCTGRIEFWVAGHTHEDSTGTLGGIPYFITASNSYSSDVPLIDLVLADYEGRTVNLVRVGGTGTDRTITLT